MAGSQHRELSVPNSGTRTWDTHIPHALAELGKALESCVRVVRQTEPTVKAVKRHLDALGDGFQQLVMYDTELKAETIKQVRDSPARSAAVTSVSMRSVRI